LGGFDYGRLGDTNGGRSLMRKYLTFGIMPVAAGVVMAGILATTSLGGVARARRALTGPTVTTQLSSAATSVGAAGVHDTATLTGLAGSTFTGDLLTYTVYPSLSACTSGTGGTSEGAVTVSGNGAVANSNTFTPTSPGTYYWQASFNGGDRTNAAAGSDCGTEVLNVDVVTTALSSTSATVNGAGVHDTATITGLTGSTLTGDAVTYTVYPSLSDCTSGTGGTSEGTETVSGNGPAPSSSTFVPASPGTYYWQASFNGGDKVDAPANSDCTTEPLTATASTATLVSTSLSSSTTVVGGSGVHDTATLTGLTGSTFTGDTVTYTVYPSQSDCASGTGGTSEGTVTVSGNGPVAASNTFVPTSPGTYYWQATFNGADKANAAASGDCSAEPLTAYPSQPTQPTPPREPRGHLVCVKVHVRRGRHHGIERICFRVPAPRFPVAGTGLGGSHDHGNGNGNKGVSDGARRGSASDGRHGHHR
jgi:hypothetical protein